MRLASEAALDLECLLTSGSISALTAWQARAGHLVTVVDPMQTWFRARISRIDGDQVWVVPFQPLSRPAESRLCLDVYQALPDKERFELVLQKLTELGATRIAPFESRRSSTREQRDAGQKKSHRWPQVVLRASRQCRRGIIPELLEVLSWDAALYLAGQADLKLLLYEGNAPWGLKEALRGETPDRVSLLIGPEGGFTAEEVEEAGTCGFLPVSLGPRILRTESAAIVATAAVQFALGDLG